MNKLNNVVCV